MLVSHNGFSWILSCDVPRLAIHIKTWPEIKIRFHHWSQNCVNCYEQMRFHRQRPLANVCKTRADLESTRPLDRGRTTWLALTGDVGVDTYHFQDEAHSRPFALLLASANTKPGDQASLGLGTWVSTACVPSRTQRGRRRPSGLWVTEINMLLQHDAARLTDRLS